MRMVVSPHDTASMFRPNSPRPPRGTTSTAGAACGSLDTDIGIPARLLTWTRRRGRAPTGEGATGSRRSSATPIADALEPTFRTAGSLPENDRRVARDYSTGRARRGAPGVRKCREFNELQGFGAPASGRCRRPRRTAAASTPVGRSRGPSRPLRDGLAPLGERGCAPAGTTSVGRVTPAGRGRKRSRTSADRTVGTGRKAPGGRARSGSTSARERGQQGEHAVVAGARAGPTSRSATSACSISVASVSAGMGRGHSAAAGRGSATTML